MPPAANQLPLTNVITVSVSQTPQGVNEYNTSNVALFTTEIPGSSFGNLGYQMYEQPGQVETDFGSASTTFQEADAIFGQTPNILQGGGQLVVIPLLLQIQNLALSGVPASGTFELHTSNGSTVAINWDDTAAQIQTKLQAVTGQSGWQVSGSLASQNLVVTCGGTYGVAPAITVVSNSLQTSGSVAITFTITQTQAGETIGAAITRTANLVQYFGIITNLTVATIGQTDLLAAAAIVEPLNKIALWVSYTEADIEAGGMLDLLRSGSFSQNRALYYGDNSVVGGVTGLNAILMMAAYAGRAFSVDFQGSNTTLDMDLKTLNGVQPDPTMTQTIYNLAQAAGADTYVSFQGDPSVSCSGTNQFFDQVYNAQWLAGALQVAAFNYLKSTSTKTPQTEQGMTGYKGALIQVLAQAVTNGYAAPGSWKSSTTFGNSQDLIANVAQVGYYIFSQPVAQQSQANRAARQAPTTQIALKEAGSIESGNIIVNVNP